MFQPNNQTLKDEHERRLALVAEWVQQFPSLGRSEKDLDRHIRESFGVSRFASHSYRRLARQRLGAAAPEMAHLAGLLLEWGEQAWEEIERSRAGLTEKVKLRTALIATLAKLAPRNVVNWQAPAEAPAFSAEDQLRFLTGEDLQDHPEDTNGTCGR